MGFIVFFSGLMQILVTVTNIGFLFFTSLHVFMNNRICKSKHPVKRTSLNKIVTIFMILVQLLAFISLWSILAAYFQEFILFPIVVSIILNYGLARYVCTDISLDEMHNVNSTIMTAKCNESHLFFWTYVISGWISPCSVIFDYITISEIKKVKPKFKLQKNLLKLTYLVNFAGIVTCLLILLLLKHFEVLKLQTTFDCKQNITNSTNFLSWNHIGALTGKYHPVSTLCEEGLDKTLFWLLPLFFAFPMGVCVITWMSLQFIGMKV